MTGGLTMIQKIELENGLRIVLEQIPHVRSVSLGIWIGTGSRYEKKDENGISHFLEHMFFKGTKTRSAKEIAESFDRIGGQVNAFTAKEYTCYYAKVLDDHATYALEILADMFFHSTFAKEELEKEKNVVLEEIKMVDDTPDDIVHDMLGEASFGEHPLGYSILGTEETLKTFSEATLRDYIKRHYTADNVVISVAGHISDELIDMLKSLFVQVPKRSELPAINKPTFLNGKINRQKETEQAHLCLGYQGLPIGHENVYGLVILNNLLGGSMSSRLFQEVREKRGLAYSIYSYHSSYQDTGMLTIYGGTAPHQLDELYEAVSETVAHVKSGAISEQELANGKEQLKGNLMLGLESTNSRMSRNGKNELMLKRHRSLDEIIEDINKVSIEDLCSIAEHIFNSGVSASLISPSGTWPKNFQ